MPNVFGGVKVRWIILAVIIAVIIVSISFMKLKYHPPVEILDAISDNPGKLTLRWTDKETDQVYTVFWSNQKDINIRDSSTYRGTKSVISNADIKTLTINVNYKWVYYIVTKDLQSTREKEAKVKLIKPFTLCELRPKIFKRNNTDDNMIINVNVSKNVEKYKIYHYLSEGSVQVEEHYVKNMYRANLRIPIIKDAFVFISKLSKNLESEKLFLLYNEKIYLGNVKWKTISQLCGLF